MNYPFHLSPYCGSLETHLNIVGLKEDLQAGEEQGIPPVSFLRSWFDEILLGLTNLVRIGSDGAYHKPGKDNVSMFDCITSLLVCGLKPTRRVYEKLIEVICCSSFSAVGIAGDQMMTSLLQLGPSQSLWSPKWPLLENTLNGLCLGSSSVYEPPMASFVIMKHLLGILERDCENCVHYSETLLYSLLETSTHESFSADEIVARRNTLVKKIFVIIRTMNLDSVLLVQRLLFQCLCSCSRTCMHHLLALVMSFYLDLPPLRRMIFWQTFPEFGECRIELLDFAMSTMFLDADEQRQILKHYRALPPSLDKLTKLEKFYHIPGTSEAVEEFLTILSQLCHLLLGRADARTLTEMSGCFPQFIRRLAERIHGENSTCFTKKSEFLLRLIGTGTIAAFTTLFHHYNTSEHVGIVHRQ